MEGYADLIALHQAGINNVVASSGTALTIEQIQYISRYTKNIYLVYDADTRRAGCITSRFRHFVRTRHECLHCRTPSR